MIPTTTAEPMSPTALLTSRRRSRGQASGTARPAEAASG
jgi:hypothetical protein